MVLEKLKKYSDGIIHLYSDGTMEKRHLFSLIAFLFAISILEVCKVGLGFRYAIWLLTIVTLLSVAYNYCKDAENNNPYH